MVAFHPVKLYKESSVLACFCQCLLLNHCSIMLMPNADVVRLVAGFQSHTMLVQLPHGDFLD